MFIPWLERFFLSRIAAIYILTYTYISSLYIYNVTEDTYSSQARASCFWLDLDLDLV